MSIKIRKRWKINPKTKIKESKRVYRRKRQKQRFKKEIKDIASEI